MEYLELAVKFIGVIVIPFVFWIDGQLKKSKTAQAKENEALKSANHLLETRIIKLETRIETVPTKDAVHELSMKMVEITGALNTMGARVNGFGKANERTERVMERVEKYLMENAK